MASYWIGVDVGGTFTDFSLFHAGAGELYHYKLSSTPDDPSRAIVEGLEAVMRLFSLAPDEIGYLAHGTTVATNALIQKKGARTALITTKGYKDLLEIGRQTRPTLYDFSQVKKPALVHGGDLREVSERVLYDGRVFAPLDEEEAERAVDALRARGVAAIAVCTIFSYVNPAHEQRIEQIVRERFPEAFVSVSHRVSPEFRETPRMSTTVVNAYLGPVMGRYIDNFQTAIRSLGIAVEPYITQSNGSIISIGETKSMPVRTALSGPSSGVVAAKYVADQCGIEQIVTFDMGGTSADICLLAGGAPAFASEKEIEGYTVRIPMIDIKTVGAGGGSIARIDEGGALKVGPESAGAVPGPAAYMRGGTRPTVTDANILLGRLNPRSLLSGRMTIDSARAREAVEKDICQHTGLGPVEAAKGIVDIVNANMMRIVRVVSVERGYDIREFTLVAFGGAGPLHACDMAEELGMRRILIPAAPGTFCSLGLLVADVKYDYVKTSITPARPEALGRISDIFSALERDGAAFLENEGVPPRDRVFARQIDARYRMQNYELTIPVESGALDGAALDALCAAFHREHARSYGYCDPSQEIELVNFRMSAVGRRQKPALTSGASRAQGGLVPKETRDVYFNHIGFARCPVYRKEDIPQDAPFCGPAVIEQMDCTVVVTPSWRCVVDRLGNILMDYTDKAGARA